MTITPQDAVALAKRIRMDLTNAQAKLTDVIECLTALPETPSTRCPECDVTLKGPLSLAEHLYNRHEGPLPDHMAKAERLAGIEAP